MAFQQGSCHRLYLFSTAFTDLNLSGLLWVHVTWDSFHESGNLGVCKLTMLIEKHPLLVSIYTNAWVKPADLSSPVILCVMDEFF